MARIVTRFPAPPGDVTWALDQLALMGRAKVDELANAGDLTDLPRPWEPSTCEPYLRDMIWQWCDRVAIWLNHEYAWRPGQMIPPCWPRHPHIARELPLLALLRWDAQTATTSTQIEEWSRVTYPEFHKRMLERLGESGCRIGKHIDWPAAARNATYSAAAAKGDRMTARYEDLNSPPEIEDYFA
jgi:hypothetical protein